MSQVRSENLRDGQRIERPRKASALISRGSVLRARTLFERVVGLALLALSGLGNYLAFHGGVFQPFDGVAAIAAGGSLALLTALQWFYRPAVPPDAWWFVKIVAWFMGLNWRYSASVIVGVALTIWGAKTIFLPIFTNMLAGFLPPDAAGTPDPLLVPAAWVLLGVVSLIVEVIPENILVD